MFQYADTNGNWVLDADELNVVIPDADQLAQFLNLTDTDQDGQVQLDELCAYNTDQYLQYFAYLRNNTENCNQLNDDYWGQVQSVVESIDLNTNFVIEYDELANYFQANGIQVDPTVAIAEIDTDQDGSVELSELCGSALSSQDPDAAPQDQVITLSYSDYQTIASESCDNFRSYDASSAGWDLYRLDSNYDTVASQDEWDAAYYTNDYDNRTLGDFDLNQDGVLDIVELCYRQGAPAINPVQDYTTYDYDDLQGLLDNYCGNYSSDVQAAAVAHFAPVDTNRDGVVTYDEFSAAYNIIIPTYTWFQSYYEFHYVDTNSDNIVDLGEACYANSGAQKIFSLLNLNKKSVSLFKRL